MYQTKWSPGLNPDQVTLCIYTICELSDYNSLMHGNFIEATRRVICVEENIGVINVMAGKMHTTARGLDEVYITVHVDTTHQYLFNEWISLIFHVDAVNIWL